jgi:hypothetical protein
MRHPRVRPGSPLTQTPFADTRTTIGGTRTAIEASSLLVAILSPQAQNELETPEEGRCASRAGVMRSLL